MLNCNDNQGLRGHQYSNPETLRPITSQHNRKENKGKSTDIRLKKYQDFIAHSKHKKNIKVNTHLNYPASACQVRHRRSRKKKVIKAGLRINSGQGNSSFPPNTHVVNSNGKVTTTNCSSLVLTWLLNSGDNRSQGGHTGSSPGNLKTCLLYTSPSPRDS